MKTNKREVATELEFLTWFYKNVRSIPVHLDIVTCLRQKFIEDVGKDLPDNYENDPDYKSEG